MIHRYAHYAAKDRKVYGDLALGHIAWQTWRALGHNAPSVVCGVAVWEDEAGRHVRVAALDLFREEPLRVIVRDV